MEKAVSIYKRLGMIVGVTIIALMYVNQKALVCQMGLKVKHNQDIHAKLIDHNKILVYNVLNLRAPANLEHMLLAKDVKFGMPKKWRVVKLTNSQTQKSFASLLRAREAEANPVINNKSLSRR